MTSSPTRTTAATSVTSERTCARLGLGLGKGGGAERGAGARDRTHNARGEGALQVTKQPRLGAVLEPVLVAVHGAAVAAALLTIRPNALAVRLLQASRPWRIHVKPGRPPRRQRRPERRRHERASQRQKTQHAELRAVVVVGSQSSPSLSLTLALRQTCRRAFARNGHLDIWKRTCSK